MGLVLLDGAGVGVDDVPSSQYLPPRPIVFEAIDVSIPVLILNAKDAILPDDDSVYLVGQGLVAKGVFEDGVMKDPLPDCGLNSRWGMRFPCCGGLSLICGLSSEQYAEEVGKALKDVHSSIFHINRGLERIP